MSNINFGNPWLLFIALPLLAAVTVPFAITVRRDNANFHNVASFVLHILMCVCITLAISGMAFETVITETNVYVLADISYSTQHNIDEVQENVEKISKKLPKNSKMGVICFGRNYVRVADLGEEVPDLSTVTKVDKSATDIASALRYAGNLFDDNVIKRIIVITDGAETVTSNNIVRVVSNLQENGVYVDAVFLDDTIDESVCEVQIDGVEATAVTFVGKTEEVGVLIRANCGVIDGVKTERTNAYVNLYRDGLLVQRRSVSLYDGLNAVKIPLYTDEAGNYGYEVRVETADPKADTTSYNNVCLFSQSVTEERKVLFIGGDEDDVFAGRDIYGVKDVTYISNPSQVPLSVEELCVYDEIVLCNFDVRRLSACTMFTSSLATLVDGYGKSLTTFGDTFVTEDDGNTIHNQALSQLADLLPVTVGNVESNGRIVALVLDISISMNFEGRFVVAKNTAKNLVDLINPNDFVTVIGYSRGTRTIVPPTRMSTPTAVKDAIDKLEAENGTNLGTAMQLAYETLTSKTVQDYCVTEKRLFIVSDGMNQDTNADEARDWSKRMAQENILVSAIGIYPTDAGSAYLESVVTNDSSNDKTFHKDINSADELDLVFEEIKAEVSPVKVEGDRYEVTLARPDEEVAEGVGSIGDIGGFWCNTAKSNSKTVLTVKYYKDKGVTSVDVPLYAYRDGSGSGNGKVSSFMSDISSNWTYGWVYGTGGEAFLANIPAATLPSERIITPFKVKVEGSGNSTTVYVETSPTLQSTSSFTASVTDPAGFTTTKPLTFDSSSYFATFSSDEPGRYTVTVDYSYNGLSYSAEVDFSVSYYAEYDAFASYSKSYMYRLLTENGEILELDEVKTIENNNSSYTSYTFKFTMPLMIVTAIAFVADIIVRQLRWKDVTSFFSGLGRRRK